MVTAVISHCLFTCCRSALAQILVCGCGHDHDGEEVEVEGVMGGGRKIAPPIPNEFLRSVTVSPAACVNNMKEKWCCAIWFRIRMCAVERASLVTAGIAKDQWPKIWMIRHIQIMYQEKEAGDWRIQWSGGGDCHCQRSVCLYLNSKNSQKRHWFACTGIGIKRIWRGPTKKELTMAAAACSRKLAHPSAPPP